jgi:hypothetical protein
VQLYRDMWEDDLTRARSLLLVELGLSKELDVRPLEEALVEAETALKQRLGVASIDVAPDDDEADADADTDTVSTAEVVASADASLNVHVPANPIGDGPVRN